VVFEGRDILKLPSAELATVRGRLISFVPQEPGIALNPVLRVGRQVAEVLAAHDACPRAQRRAATEALLTLVGLPDPDLLHDAYPHELSGGQQQRVAIAQAVACRPRLVVADEPTTALDPASRAAILSLLRRLNAELGLALVVVSHDLSSAVPLADRLVVMYAGRVVEEGPTDAVMAQPRHPYTRGLLASMPAPGSGRRETLATIPGSPPEPGTLTDRCAFEPRCEVRLESCRAGVPALTRQGRHGVRCVRHDG
jgi:peptide/nickel transport system ATP-binding protein